jgi:hypothetical protein
VRLLFVSMAAFQPAGLNGPLLGLLDLLRALAARDTEPALLCRDASAIGPRVVRHDGHGFPLFSAADPAVAAAPLAAAAEAAALVLLEGADGRLIASCGGVAAPVFAWFGRPIAARPAAPLAPGVTLLADGPELAAAVGAWYGAAVTILPLPAPRLTRAPTREQVLFLDPRPAGGIEILFALAAARPRTTFIVAEAEALPDAWRSVCFARAARCGNLDWRSGVGALPSLLARARLLLAPDLAPDADPWAIRAAQAAGIPALAARHGVLPEALGAAGLLVDPYAASELWLAAFDRLWHDQPLYDEACAAATRQAAARSVDAVADALVARLAGAGGSAKVA